MKSQVYQLPKNYKVRFEEGLTTLIREDGKVTAIFNDGTEHMVEEVAMLDHMHRTSKGEVKAMSASNLATIFREYSPRRPYTEEELLEFGEDLF